MSFVAECTFCQGKVRVPDNALGLSVPCPRCGNSFTLACETHRPEAPPVVGSVIKGSKKASAPLQAMTGPRTPTLLAPRTTAAGDAPVSEEYVKQVLQTNQLQPGLSPEADDEAGAAAPGRRRKVNYFGLASLVLASLALMLAQVPLLNVLTIPVSGAALLGGLVGWRVQGHLPKSGLVFSAAGTTLSLAVIIVAFCAPDLLNLDLRLGSAKTLVDPDRQQQVGLKGETFQTAGASDWVDASKGSFQHGAVRVRVLAEYPLASSREARNPEEEVQPRVYVKPVALKNSKGQSVSETPYLVIYLRLINAGATSQAVYRSWSKTGPGDSAAVRLRDKTGRTYRSATFGPGVEVEGQLRQALLLPGKPVVDVLVFEAPAEGVDHLRLELPASAFGGTGKLRLHLPASMIEFR